ncbi:response regulator transcription factor [Nocardioides sp. SYSU DS0663]|uniref:response regulator transcription factor n=1 Tax=Nocardioides sp. SYSU DS0663 TaxID=3416445 RepID=UPI003F4B1D77
MPPGPIRLAVVNDYELVVAGVAAMMAPLSDQVRVVEIDSGLPVRSDVDVVLYDTFAQVQGERIELESLVAESGAKVVVYSWTTDAHLVEETLRRGAAGYLSKGLGAEAIAAALEKVRAGELVRPDASAEGWCHGADDLEGQETVWPGKDHGLTPRESEILALITQGLSNREIAAQTFLSINSVKTYIRTAYRKVGVARRSQAVGWGMRHGFAPDRVRRILE